jgi:hypothetical protein
MTEGKYLHKFTLSLTLTQDVSGWEINATPRALYLQQWPLASLRAGTIFNSRRFLPHILILIVQCLKKTHCVVSCRAVSCRAVPYCVLFRAVLYLVMAYCILLRRAVPYRPVLHLVVPCCILLCRVMPYSAVSCLIFCRAVSCRTVPCRAVLYLVA